MLSGVVYQWEAVIAGIFDDIRSGSFTGRQEADRFYWINAENEGLNYAPINDPKGWLTDEDKAQIEDTFKKLQAGEIEIPEFKQGEAAK